MYSRSIAFASKPADKLALAIHIMVGQCRIRTQNFIQSRELVSIDYMESVGFKAQPFEYSLASRLPLPPLAEQSRSASWRR